MHCEVVEVDGGAAAMAVLQHDQQFDVIMMDYVMPQKNGVEVVRELRGSGIGVPVILCSGYVNETNSPEIFDIVDGHLEKPFRSEALISAIEMVVNRQTGLPVGGTAPVNAAPGFSTQTKAR